MARQPLVIRFCADSCRNNHVSVEETYKSYACKLSTIRVILGATKPEGIGASNPLRFCGSQTSSSGS
jgi:hypothetical protein